MMCDKDTPVGPYFLHGVNFIMDSFNYDMNVMVHCKEGTGRSATMVAAFLVYRFKIGWEEAVGVVERRRGILIGEEGREELRSYEERLRKFKHVS